MGNHALESVGPERAALAAFGPVGREHEMLHHKLAAAGEQIAQCLLAVGTVEHISLVDLDPGQRAPLFAEPVARPCVFLLVAEMRLARFDPLFTRDDFMRLRLHDGLLSDRFRRYIFQACRACLSIRARGRRVRPYRRTADGEASAAYHRREASARSSPAIRVPASNATPS